MFFIYKIITIDMAQKKSDFDSIILELTNRLIKDVASATGQKDNILVASIYNENREDYDKKLRKRFVDAVHESRVTGEPFDRNRAKELAYNSVRNDLMSKTSLKINLSNVKYTKETEKQKKIVGDKTVILNINSRMRSNKTVEEPNNLVMETTDLKEVLINVKSIRLTSEPQLPDCPYFNKNFNGCDFYLNILGSQVATGNILETNVFNRNNGAFKLSIKPRRIGATYMIEVLNYMVNINPPINLKRILNFTFTDTYGNLLPLEKDISRIESAYIDLANSWIRFTVRNHDINSGDKLRLESVSFNNGTELFNKEFLAIVIDANTVAIKQAVATPTDDELIPYNGGNPLPIDDPLTAGTNEYTDARDIALENWKSHAIGTNSAKMYVINNTVNFSLEIVLASQ